MTSIGSKESYDAVNRLQAVLRKEDDRGVVLLAMAFMEDLLGRLIEAYLLDGKPAQALLHGFNAPLGTLSSRIKAAQALGLITDVQYADLELLRRIRNEIAHTWERVDLETPGIADRVKELSPTRLPDNPGDVAGSLSESLRQCVSCTIVELETMAIQLGLGKRGERLRNIGLHLYPGPAVEVRWKHGSKEGQ